MNGAEWFVRSLKQRGVEQIFVLCGNGLNPFLDACLDEGMPLIDVRNEQAASFMADLYGRMTGRLGVVAVSSGPGHTNALTGLANAAWDGGPMLLISGSSPASTRGLDHFQELDQVSMVRSLCKFASYVDSVRTLVTDTDRAVAAAISPRPGPVHLTIPCDVWATAMPAGLGVSTPASAEVFRGGPGDRALVREAAKLLCEAEKPIVFIGSGAFYSREAGGGLEVLAEETNMPMISQLWDRGCIEKPMRQYIGVTTTELNAAFPKVAECDVALVLGARVDFRLGHGLPPVFSPDVTFVRVDADPDEIRRTIVPEVGIVGDVAMVLEQLLDEIRDLGGMDVSGWLADLRELRDASVAGWEAVEHDGKAPLPGYRICLALREFLDQEVTFLLDGGNIGRWFYTLLHNRHPSHWATCGISGVIGWGLPGGIVANLVRPGKPVLLLSGDGSAGFTISEIETGLRFNAPYVAVIAHDSAWGIVADGQGDDRLVASELGEIRYDKVAEALGARGVYVESEEQLKAAIAEGLALPTVTVIHVPTVRGGLARLAPR